MIFLHLLMWNLFLSDIFGSFARGRFMNICVLYLVNLFLKISCLSPADGRSLLPKRCVCVFFFDVEYI